VPWASSHNLVAVDLTAEHIRLKLRQHPLLRVYPNLHLLPSNFQVRKGGRCVWWGDVG
jgi:uridine kinase